MALKTYLSFKNHHKEYHVKFQRHIIVMYLLSIFAMYTFALQWNDNITKYNYENAVV